MNKEELAKILNINSDNIEEINEEIDNNCHKIYIKFKKESCTCPKCQSTSLKNKGYKTRLTKGKVLSNFPTAIYVKQRIYKCKKCNHVFNQKNELFENGKRISNETTKNIIDQLKYPCTTYESVAIKI